MKVALTGATGFVGRHVLARLHECGHEVRALVRAPASVGPAGDVTEIVGDLDQPQALRQLVAGADAVIHLVGIIRQRPRRGQTFQRIHVEGTHNLLRAATAAGVRRWVHMSALGTRPQAASFYHQTKYAAEQAVRAASLQWTIFRPSLIHGPDGEFMRMVKGLCTGLMPPFLPYFGRGLLGLGGAGLLQPVWVRDVAQCFVAALKSPAAVGRVYELGGPDRYTWPQFYEVCRRHIPTAKKKPIVAIPVWLAKLMARLPVAPFNVDQVIMSGEDNICDTRQAQFDLGVALAAFEPTFSQYATTIA